MLIDEYQAKTKRDGLTIEKEIKVKIPLDYHIRLHTVKVVRGQAISDTIKMALEHYFADLRTDAGAAPLAGRLFSQVESG